MTTVPFQGLFELKTPADLVWKLRHDLERMATSPQDQYAAFDFFVTAEHIVDWIHPGDRAARESLRSSSPLLRITSHLANGGKHFEAKAAHHRSVTGTEKDRHVEEGYVEEGYFEEPLLIHLIGLFHSYQHPELVIYGLRREVAHQVLSNAVEGLPHGRRLDLAKSTDELLVGYSCCFIEVPKSAYHEHVGWARWYYGGDDFPLYQVMWPSRDGYFPWHPKANAEFRQVQPVIGHAPVGI
jgi:hypothetical protein